MDRFLCLQAFARVAETCSFAEAARQLHVTPSVITQRVGQLEEFVQSALFHRSTRSVQLSEAGLAFFNECAEVVSHMDSALERMRALRTTPAGRLRLQILPGFALKYLGEVIRDFNALYPNIEVDLSVDDSPVNPVDKGYDVSLQVFRPGAETLIERPLFQVQRVFCASPMYLAQNGTPQVPADLTRHYVALYSAYPTRDRWTFDYGKEEVSVLLTPMLRCNSIHVLRDFALAGGGITCLPTFVCGDELLNGKLTIILPEYKLRPLELLAIYPVTHRRALKVKLFVDYMAQRYSGNLPWDEALRRQERLMAQHAATSETRDPRPPKKKHLPADAKPSATEIKGRRKRRSRLLLP